MAKKPPLNEVVKAFSLNKTQDEWVKRGTVAVTEQGRSELISSNTQSHTTQPSVLVSARENDNKSTSEHIEKANKLVYFSARIPLEVRNAIRVASVYRKNVGLIPASEQDITRVALLEWLERNHNGQDNKQ
jgi:hypothetical protein